MTKSPKSALAAVILAASPDRFASQLPKELHPLLGRPVVEHALAAAAAAGCDPVVVATTKKRSKAIAGALPERSVVSGDGAGEARLVRAGLAALEGTPSAVLVLLADQPALSEDHLLALREAYRATRAPLALLTTVHQDPAWLRVVRGPSGGVVGVRRARSGLEVSQEVAAGAFLCGRALLERVLGGILRARRPAPLLPALVEAAAAVRPAATATAPAEEVQRVTTRLDLARACGTLRERLAAAHALAGVTLEDPATAWIEADVALGSDVTIGANVQLRGHTRLDAGVIVEPNVVIIDCAIEAGARVRSFSHLEGARVRGDAIVGPFARLRPLADIGAGAHIGNFVEVKKAVVEAGAKANHFAYLGDARVGSRANVGAGTICCNYDGVGKHHTDIGAGVFVGSNSTLVAPVEIGDGAYVAAGSTLTQDVPAGALAFGRARQENKSDMAARIRRRAEARAKQG